MSKKLTKKQKARKKQQKKERHIKKLERLDDQGIQRKKWKFTYTPKRFMIVKSILIGLIPILYFIYSPLLVVVMIAYIGLFYLAMATERHMNKSVIKSNHIKIPKFDSAIALLVVVIALLGSIFGVSGGRVGRFSNTLWMKFTTSLRNFGSLLTGKRALIGGQKGFGFGTQPTPPEGFIPDSEAFNEMMGPMPGGRPDMDIDFSDLPIEFMFSQILSTVQTALVFAVAVIGLFSLIMTQRKIKRFNIQINEFVIDGDIKLIDDQDIDKILSFGEEELIE